MSSRDIARQWFVPGDGIDRHVISADIQRYLGNDATVRPGKGTNEHEGIDGYWIKAYRNLTSAMVHDLRADSARWRQEQRSTGTRGTTTPDPVSTSLAPSGNTEPDSEHVEPYVGSSTYHQSSAARPTRREGDSPRAPEHGSSTRERERIPAARIPVDSMDIDPPSRGSIYMAGGGARPPYSHGDRPAFPSDRGYPPEPPSDRYGGRPSVSAPYGGPIQGHPIPPQSDGAPPGYVKQGQYYVPISHLEPPPSSRMEPRFGSGGYGDHPPYPTGRDHREPARYGQPDYQDPARAYPSPATTVSSVPTRDRGTPSGNPQSYGAPAIHYDVYGRPIQEPPSTGLPPPSRQSVRASVFMGDAPDLRDTRRRR